MREEDLQRLHETKENLIQELNLVKNKCCDTEEKLLQVEAELLHALAEVNVST